MVMYKDLTKAMSWCLHNNIKVYVEPINKGKKSNVRIVINNKGKITKGKQLYIQDERLSNKIKEIYYFLYNRYN